MTDAQLARLRAGDTGQISVDRLIDALNNLHQIVSVAVTSESVKSKDSRPIWEKIAARAAAIPPEALENVPTDLAENLDHYLYGSPKQY